MRTLQHYLKTGPASVLLFIIGLLASVNTWAQERGVDINVTTDTNDVAWYGHWWVWLIGGALFVIILVAIVSAGKKT